VGDLAIYHCVLCLIMEGQVLIMLPECKYSQPGLNNSMEQSPSWKAVTQLVKKFSAFYRSQRFITEITTAHYWSLSWARWILCILSYCIIILSSMPMSSKWFCFFRSSDHNYVHISHLTMCYKFHPSHPWCDHPDNIWWSVQSQSSPLGIFSSVLYHFLLGPTVNTSSTKIKIIWDLVL